LFRIEPVPGVFPSRHAIVVQSAIEPHWDYAFHNAPKFLCAKPLVRPFNPQYAAGERLRFRLRANPTKRLRANKEGPDSGKPGKRIGLSTEAEQIRWLLHKGEDGGFRVPGEWLEARRPETNEPIQIPNFRLDVIPEGRDRNDKPGHAGNFLAVRFEGMLIVTDLAKFRETVTGGLGSAKAFGFGLLSVARAED
jgi:CRISPR system Cascade subunit CasE